MCLLWVKSWAVTMLGVVQGNAVACQQKKLHTGQLKRLKPELSADTQQARSEGTGGQQGEMASAAVTIWAEGRNHPGGCSTAPHICQHGPCEQLPPKLYLYGHWHWQMAKQGIIGLRTQAQTEAWKTPTENHLIQLELESISYQHYREEGEKSHFSPAWWFCLLTRAIL